MFCFYVFMVPLERIRPAPGKSSLPAFKKRLDLERIFGMRRDSEIFIYETCALIQKILHNENENWKKNETLRHVSRVEYLFSNGGKSC